MSTIRTAHTSTVEHPASNWKSMALCSIGNGHPGTISSFHSSEEVPSRSRGPLYKVGGSGSGPDYHGGSNSTLLLKRGHMQIRHPSYLDY